MLTQIKINQDEIFHRELHTKTDITDWMIIQYMQWIETNTKRTHINGRYYHRVSLRLLIHNLPMSGLKTESGMCKRIQKLVKNRLVSVFRSANNHLYFRLGYVARNIAAVQNVNLTTYDKWII